MRRILAAVLVGLAGGVVAAQPAGAHAEIREADPPVDGVAPVGTEEVSMTFISMDADEPVDVSVLDEHGGEQVDGDVVVGETTALGTEVRVPVRPLEEGPHLVSWRAMSDDGDGITADVYEFTVEEGSSGGGLGVWLIWVVALVVLAALVVLPRRRRRPGGTPPT
jgi:MYXO-CTERM domain-containing protein